jgi:hypothetical protein
MSEIANSGRGPFDQAREGLQQGLDSRTRAGSDANARMNTGGDRRLSDRLAMADRAKAFGARMAATRRPGEAEAETRDPAPKTDDAARVLATAQWSGGLTGPPPDAFAQPTPDIQSEAGRRAAEAGAMAETVSARIESALAADLGRRPGDPIALRLQMADAGWAAVAPAGLRELQVSITPSSLDILLVRTGHEIDLAPAAAELAAALARRFEGRRVTIRESVVVDRDDAVSDGSGLSAFSSLFAGGSARA